MKAYRALWRESYEGAQDGESAKAGIEHADGGRRRGMVKVGFPRWAWLRR